MGYAITKDFTFSASHQLSGLAPGHQCARMHGHNYVARVRLCSPSVDAVGFVLDYGDLHPFKAYLDDHLDHRHLNDVMVNNPTAENLARLLWGALLTAVGDRPPLHFSPGSGMGISETPKTWAWYLT
jgi:6-pyruvoyltetrahydropterin/6-carboxytetrahydropterin synthase